MRTPQEMIRYIHENIDGRMCDEFDNCLYLASAVHDAGGGNYLEIGSLFGGSAILARMVMDDLGYEGDVYAVDPFDGYYVGIKNDNKRLIGGAVDTVSHKSVTIERAQANAEKMGAKVNFIKGAFKTELLPQALSYSVVYIDGDHWNEGPLNDWNNIKDRADKFVVFDNCDKGHPAVERAVATAWLDPEWTLTFKHGITAIMERVL